MTALPRIAEGVFEGPDGVRVRSDDDEICKEIGATQGPLYWELIKLAYKARQGETVDPLVFALRIADLTLRAEATQLERTENAKIISEMVGEDLGWDTGQVIVDEIRQPINLEPPAAA